MKTVDDHFKRLLKQLNVEKLVSPKTDNKIGALERECEKGKRLSQELGSFFELGLEAVAEFKYLNSIVPGEHLGDKLFDASFTSLRKHELNIRDLASIVDYVAERVKAHVISDTYQMNHYSQDKEMVNLPQHVAQLTNASPGLAGNFLKYLKHIAIEASPDRLPEFYQEFKEIVQDAIIAAGTYYSGVLEVRRLGKSWNELRAEKSGDERAVKWINMFEELEKKYQTRDLPQIARLYKRDSDSNL